MPGSPTIRDMSDLQAVFDAPNFRRDVHMPIIDGITLELFGDDEVRRSKASDFIVRNVMDGSDLFAPIGGESMDDAGRVLIRGAWRQGLDQR